MIGSIIRRVRGDDVDGRVFGEMLDQMYASAKAICFSTTMLMVAAVYCSLRTGDDVFIALSIAAAAAGMLRIANSVAYLSRRRRGETRRDLRAWQLRYALAAFLYSAAFGGMMFRSAVLGDVPT
ncbi:MAG: hypothetical protein EOO83_05870, partial [Oxalobacteraceae bacterium]